MSRMAILFNNRRLNCVIFYYSQEYRRQLSCTVVKNALFYEKDPKGGYKTTSEYDSKSRTELIRNGLKELKQEIVLWKNEMQDKFEMDPILINRPGETDVVWKFDSQQSLDRWICTSDKNHSEGSSTCNLQLSPEGKGVFSGELCTKVPKDGKIQRAGYVNMRSARVRKSFKREAYFDWACYNKLVMKVRGDGRSYMLNLSTAGYFDVMWNDMFQYILFTRGGPYWQIAKIPFSKFFFSSKGRIQDIQHPIALNRVTHFGISLGDKINGKFNLEIDYIGVEYDPNHHEEFAYELYKTNKYILAN